MTVPNLGTDFTSQKFIIWDYDEDSPNTTTYEEHYSDLFNFSKTNGVSKVIIFPKDPSVSANDFFLLKNQDVTNSSTFVYWLNQFKNSNIEVDIFFTSDYFADELVPANEPPLDNSFYFSNLSGKMNWVNQLTKIVPGAVTGISVDPEDQNSGAEAGYKQVMDYMDQYRYANGFPKMNLGITLGIDDKNTTIEYLSPVSPAPAYRNGDEAPKINNVYIQAYEPNFVYIFSGQLSPEDAALAFIKAFQDIPYRTSAGTLTVTEGTNSATYTPKQSEGTISCTSGSATCTYIGNNFASEIQVEFNLTVGSVGSSQINVKVVATDASNSKFTILKPIETAVTNQQFLIDNFALEVQADGMLYTTTNQKIGAVSENTPNGYQFELAGNSQATLNNQPFLYSETPFKWTNPQITEDIAKGIVFLLSVQFNPPTGDTYFGTWSLQDFMTFCKTFIANVSSVNGNFPINPIFTSDGNVPSTTNGVSFGVNNLGIYDYFLLKQAALWPNKESLETTTKNKS
jgi:hypothetical protein